MTKAQRKRNKTDITSCKRKEVEDQQR